MAKNLAYEQNNLLATGNNITKLVQVMCREASVEIRVLIFRGLHP